jgi:integrase
LIDDERQGNHQSDTHSVRAVPLCHGATAAARFTICRFGIKNNFKKSFLAACKAAGIQDLRFHDLRHTAITRMIEAGMQPAEVMRVSGHTTPAMMWRYLNANVDTARRAADALDVLRLSKAEGDRK